MSKVNCLQCKHYYNTWDKDVPRGCRLYSMKSMNMPSMAVKRESGKNCMGYVQKEHFKNSGKKKQGQDLNDPALW